MAASQAVIGFGTLIQRGDVATATGFVTIGEITKYDAPDAKVDLKKSTHMESPGRYEEKIAGLIDPGEAKIECNFVPSITEHSIATGVIADHASGISRYWRRVMPTDPVINETFFGFVSMLTVDTPLEDVIKMKFTVTLSGAIVKEEA